VTVSETDVIVVGAGLAGLTAAYDLARQGVGVVLLEKQPSTGGSSALSGGWFAFSGTDVQHRAGVEDSADAFLADMIDTGGGYADRELLGRMVQRQAAAIEVIDRARAWTDELKVSAGMRTARAHLVHIRDVLTYLERGAVANGAAVLTAEPAHELIVDGSRVSGVRTSDGELRALSGVVLTSGGFSRSQELLDLFVPEQAGAMPYGGVGNTGDGLRMAWRQGAGLADIGHVAGTYGQHTDTRDDEHELLTASYLGAILLNADGDRFVDESAPYKDLGRAVLAQRGGMAFQVFDASVRARSKPGVPLSDIDRIEALGHIVRASSLDELERMLQIPPGRLRRAVEEYNVEAVEESRDRLGRTGLVNGVGELVPVAEPPFFAYPAVTAMTSTYGGITVAPDTAVLRVDGTRIDGLYAAGEIAGGFHGASYMTGTALTKALVFGREAAAAALR
jgi:fumarate reductase flavoprotein subunit